MCYLYTPHLPFPSFELKLFMNLPPLTSANASTASPWVRKYAPFIPHNAGPVLDLACGSGRHTRLLLEAGHEVWALDKDPALLAPLAALGAKCFAVDLEHESPGGVVVDGITWPFAQQSFAGIIVTNYLYRPLMPLILGALKNQGVLIYETFALGNERYGRPGNPNFLLRDNELLEHFIFNAPPGRNRQCIAYEHGYVKQPKEAVIQSICMKFHAC
jgi:SAM-dependent methyltransferase